MLTNQIGETAGHIWHTLEEEGPLRIAALKNQLEVPELIVHMALGWLAREDKIVFESDGRAYRVRLK